MELKKAKKIAKKYIKILEPFCERIKIAGSIRREKKLVKDIEICVIPKTKTKNDLFEEYKEIIRDTNFINNVYKLGILIRGNPVKGKNVQIKLPEKINLDIFICDKENWGLIFFIRTGSNEFVKNIFSKICPIKGYKSINGEFYQMYKSQPYKKIKVEEEEDIFKLLNIQFIEPCDR